MCMHVRRHVRRHACGHVSKHAHRHVCADVYMRTCVQTCVCRHVRAPMCAHLCTHMGTHGQACVRACVGRHVRTLVSEGHTYVGHEYIRTTSLGRTPLRDRGCTQPCMGRGMHVALHGPWGACSPAEAVREAPDSSDVAELRIGSISALCRHCRRHGPLRGYRRAGTQMTASAERFPTGV